MRMVAAQVMERLQLGPNGALMYCIEFLEQNLGWLQSQIEARPERYFLIDCPGQIELYTHHRSFHNMLEIIQRDWKFQICAVNLVDSHYCADASKFISVLLTSLTTMLHLATPHINVLSKIDLVEAAGPLPLRLDVYTDVLDLSYVLAALEDDPFASRYHALNAALVELVEDFSLVSFNTLNVADKHSLASLIVHIDKAIAFVQGDDGKAQDVDTFTAAFGAGPQHLRDVFLDAEKYL